VSFVDDAGDGWIVEPAFRRLTPNRYDPKREPHKVQPIEFVVYHYTAGPFQASLHWLITRASQVSAHFIVRKTGDVWQLASLNERTWHAGGRTSLWRGNAQVNNRSIGIEIENWGPVTVDGPDSDPIVRASSGKQIESGIFYREQNGKCWDDYTEVQLSAVCELTRRLVHAFPQLRETDGMAVGPPAGRFIGHQHVDPTRKVDPGPAFPWPRVLAAASLA
jgi:N-acetyl-anhydromuramyl-L-alanine amidase AmpD